MIGHSYMVRKLCGHPANNATGVEVHSTWCAENDIFTLFPDKMTALKKINPWINQMSLSGPFLKQLLERFYHQ